MPVLPPQTWGSLSLGLGAPGPSCLQLGCCSLSTTLPPSHLGPGRRPRLPGSPRDRQPGSPAPERCRWTWQACPLGREFSFLAKGLGRARTPWGDEGARGLSCVAGFSRVHSALTALPTVQPPPPGAGGRRAAAQRWGGCTPAPPAAGQLLGRLLAPSPAKLPLSYLPLGGPLSGPPACGRAWAAALTPGLS